MFWDFLEKLAKTCHDYEAAREMGGRKISYGELHKQSIEVAHKIRSTAAEGVICTKMNRGIDWYIVYWATVYLQRPIVSLSIDFENKDAERQREEDVMTQLYPSVLVEFEEDDLVITSMDHNVTRKFDCEGVLLYCFTGGTTAKSKLVPVTHEMALWEVSRYPDLFPNLVESSTPVRVLQQYSFFWGAAIFGTIDVALAFKGSVCFSEACQPDKLVSIIELLDVNVMGLNPFYLDRMDPDNVPQVKTVISWAERCPREVAEKWGRKTHFIDLLIASEYWLCFYRKTGNEFYAMDNCEICIKPDDEMENDLGELLLHGPMVFRGYGSPPDTSCFVYFDGKRFYKTGDVVRLTSKSSFTHHGRVQSSGLGKVGGNWVDWAAIEDKLSTPEVECKIIKDDERQVYICFATGTVNKSLLPPNTEVLYVSKIPRNEATGKVNMRRLLALVRPWNGRTKFPTHAYRNNIFGQALLIAALKDNFLRQRIKGLPYLYHFVSRHYMRSKLGFGRLCLFLLTAPSREYWKFVRLCVLQLRKENPQRAKNWDAVFWRIADRQLGDEILKSPFFVRPAAKEASSPPTMEIKDGKEKDASTTTTTTTLQQGTKKETEKKDDDVCKGKENNEDMNAMKQQQEEKHGDENIITTKKKECGTLSHLKEGRIIVEKEKKEEKEEDKGRGKEDDEELSKLKSPRPKSKDKVATQNSPSHGDNKEKFQDWIKTADGKWVQKAHVLRPRALPPFVPTPSSSSSSRAEVRCCSTTTSSRCEEGKKKNVCEGGVAAAAESVSVEEKGSKKGDEAMPMQGGGGTPMHGRVAEMIASVMGVPFITADYKLLNLDSLRVTTLASRLGIPASMILKAPDVESLQKCIDEKKHEGIVVKDPREAKIYIYGHYGSRSISWRLVVDMCFPCAAHGFIPSLVVPYGAVGPS